MRADIKAFAMATTTGLVERQQKNFSVFPNPSKGIFHLTSNHNTVIEISNLLGDIVYFNDHIIANENIDLSSLNNGIYFIKAQNGIIQKVIIEK